MGGKYDIYVMKPDGSEFERITSVLTSGDFDHWSPVWSPDGKSIAFVSRTSFDWLIRTINIRDDFSAPVEKVANICVFSCESPSWSPDGSQIAYVSKTDLTNVNDDPEIFVRAVTFDSEALAKGIQLTSNDDRDEDPAWSPNGSQIAFVSNRDGDAEIFVMNTDGTGLRQLTDNRATEGDPAWSPDGSQIAFVRNRETSDNLETFRSYDVFVMNADGTGVRQLTNNDHYEASPVWSPDGSRIAFASGRYGNCILCVEVFVMNADGTDVVATTRPGTPGSWTR